MTVKYYCISALGNLPAVEFEMPFKVAIVADIALPNERQNEVSDWLYAEGARYTSAWGVAASSWDDSVDWAQISAWPDGAPDEHFCMTSWHDNEPLEEMFCFVKYSSGYYDGTWNEQIAIVHISDKADEEAVVARFDAASW